MTSGADPGVLGRLQAILADLLVLEPSDVKPDSRLLDDLDADSITFIELAFAIEREFGVRLPEVKADEETLAMPLPDGLRKLDAMPGAATFFEFLKRSAIRDAAGRDTALEDAERERFFRSHTVATLASAAGAEVPGGFDPSAPIGSLRLRDLFRFLTVGTMADYVQYLLDTKE